jgi:hypothetical protein
MGQHFGLSTSMPNRKRGTTAPTLVLDVLEPVREVRDAA